MDNIRKFALQNAIQFNGTCSQGSIMGKVLADNPDLKKDMKTLSMNIQTVVKEVNSLSLEQQKEELSKSNPELLEKKKKERRVFTLPDLKNTDNLVMRFAPNPNGAMSFGHSRPALLNWWFVEKYKGKFILRLDDTDPRTKVPLKEAYDWFEEDLKWLGIRIDEKIIQSERFNIYYNYAEDLIKKDCAYVCTCDSEIMRALLREKEACPCRDLNSKENLRRWNKMLTAEFKEGEAILRMKTDLNDKNPAVRDWPAFRIITSGNHPRKEANVWPLLNFCSAIDDHELKVTHIIRGIDLQVSDDRQKFIYNVYNWTYPETIYIGKLIIDGIKSTSESRKLIEEGKLTGWDDIRLGTLKSLKKRGFQKEAIQEFVKSVGLNKNNVEVSLDTVESFNKDVIDKTSNRYFFIKDPIKIKIKGTPEKEVELNSHPDKKGGRIFHINDTFFLSNEDLEDGMTRLMDCLNFTKEGDDLTFHSWDFVKGVKLIHWLPEEQIKIKVRLPNNDLIDGIGEKGLEEVKEGQIVQFERFGFCKKNKGEFWYTHG